MKKTLTEIKIDGDEQKEWTTQPVQIVPNKLPKQVYTNPQPNISSSQSNMNQAIPLKVGENRVGEETKKYFSPEHHPVDPEKASPSMTQRIEEFTKEKDIVKQFIQSVETAEEIKIDTNKNVVDSFKDDSDTLYTLKVRADSDSHYITIQLPQRNKSNIKVLEPSNAPEVFKALKLQKLKK